MSTAAQSFNPAVLNRQKFTEAEKHVHDLLKKFDAGMLVTQSSQTLGNVGPQFRARPMMLAQVEDNGICWLITGKDTGKVQDIEDNSAVLITFQDGKSCQLSLAGQARLVSDPQKIKELWQEQYRVWFSHGEQDSSILLIQVIPTEAEYWDNSGLNALKYMMESTKAYFSGEEPHIDEPDQHARVKL